MKSLKWFINNFTVSFFSIILGINGFTISLSKIENIFNIGLPLSNYLGFFSLGLFSVMLWFFITRLIFFPRSVYLELHNPIKISFFPTISVCFILYSIIFYNKYTLLATYFWYIGCILHIILTFLIIYFLFNKAYFRVKHLSPSWFIPIIGNFLLTIIGRLTLHIDLSWFFFSVGLILWIILLTIIFYRLIFNEILPDNLRPTLFIMIAPPALAFVAYSNLVGSLDNFGRILYYFSFFIFLVLLSQLKIFFKLKFSLSWWAYSFSLGNITIATTFMYNYSNIIFYKYLAIVLTTSIFFVILTLSIKTLKTFFRKEIDLYREINIW